MINNNKTNDWFTAILFNPDKDVPDLVAAGLDKDNTGLQLREFYKNKSRVQEMFSDEKGIFNEVAFNLFYDSATRTYNNFVDTQLEDNFLDDQIHSSRDIDIDPDTKRRQNRFDVIPVRNPMNLTTGTTSLFGLSESQFTMQEIAQTRKVFDPESGLFLDYTPNDAGGSGIGKAVKRIGKTIFGPTLTLATYDEDGEHQLADGRMVKHHKGDLKYDSEDMPFYEILGDRSPYGRLLLHLTDILTVDGSTANKYDFFDSDSREKSIVGSTAKLIATLAPVVIKGTRTPYAYLTAAQSFGTALTGMFKAADEWLEGGDLKERSTTWKALNNFEGFLKRFEGSQTEEAQSKMMGYETFTTMLSDIVLQLYQQRAVANMVQKTPKWLGMGKSEMNATKRALAQYNPQYVSKYGKNITQAIKDGDLAPDFRDIAELTQAAARFNRLEKLGKTGGNLSKMYMAITQAGGMIETMDEAGFTPEGKIVGTLAALYGFKKIFDSELGDVALKGFGFDDISNTTRRFFQENVKQIEAEVAKKTGNSALSKTAQLGLGKKFGNKLHKLYRWGMDHPNDYINASAKEALEEMSEELLQDGILTSLSTLENLFRPDGGNTYDFFETNPMERYLMSALGGALGGPIFTGIDKIERGTWGIHKSADVKTRDELINHIRQGKAQEIMTSLDNIIRSNKSGLSTQLSTRLAEELSADGKPYFLPSESESDSQAWVLGENIKGWVKTVDSVLNNEGYALKDGDIIFKALGQNMRLNNLVRSGVDVGILNDFRYSLNNLLEARLSQEQVPEGETSLSINEKYNAAKQNIDSIINGERADYYTKKIGFMMSNLINSSFLDANIEMYALARGIDYNAMSEDSKNKLRAEYDLVKGNNDEQLVYNWSEIAFRAYQNMERIIAPTLVQFGDNYALDPTTGSLVMDQNFSKAVEELQNVFPSTRPELTPEERTQILEKYRFGKTNEDILQEMNPNDTRLTEELKLELVDRYLMSIPMASREVESIAAAKWIVLTFGQEALTSPEALKYGLDSMVMLKNREQLRQTLQSIREIMLKYNINYIDSRTNDALLRMEKAVNDVKVKDLFKVWSSAANPDGVNNLVNLLVANDIESFSYVVKGVEGEEEFEVEGEGVVDLSQDEVWTIRKEFDSDGMPIITNTGHFKVVSENGVESQISIEELSDRLYDQYLANINNISDFTNAAQTARANIDNVINQRLAGNNVGANPGDLILSDIYNSLEDDFNERVFLVNEAENLRTRVLKNPIYDSLRKASEQILGVGEDIFTLIQREEEELGKRSSLKEYVLSDLIKSDRLSKAYTLLQSFKNIVNGRIKNSTDFDFNDIINNFLSKYKGLSPDLINRENPTISPEIATIINRDIESIQEKILYLLNLDLVNNSSKFQDSAKSQVRMNSLMIKALTGQLGTKFGFIKNAQLNGELFFNFEEMGITAEDMETVSEYLESDSAFSDEAIFTTEELLTRIKQYIYNKFNSDEIDDGTRHALLLQMMDGLNLNVKEQRIDLKMTNDRLNPFTAFTVLLSTISSDPVKFRQIFTEEIGELIPYSMQLFNSEVMSAYADNNKWFAAAINEVNQNLAKYFPGNDRNAEINESFTNVLFSWGNAGAGKTVFLANMVAKQFTRNNPDGKIWVAGPNSDRAINLTQATGVASNFDRTALFKLILTPEAFNRYLKMMAFMSQNKEVVNGEINGKTQSLYEYYARRPISIDVDGQQVVLSKNVKQLADDFISAKDVVDKPDLLIIDEITKFDTFEIQILDRAGIKVIALGDRSQVSARLFGKPHNPDGIYMNTAELAMSVRSTNIHKKDNHSMIGATMNILLDEFETAPGSNLSEMFDKHRQLTTFTYYETEEDGRYILNGEKIVNKLNVFGSTNDVKGTVEGLVRDLGENEQLVYINNPSSGSYSEMERLSLKYPGKIDFKTLDEVQGKEYKYGIVDINFTELVSAHNLYKNDELLDSLKEFNTAISRSMDGTIIVDNETSPYHIENSTERGYTSPTGDSKSELATEYAQRITKILVDTTPNVPTSNENVPTGQQVNEVTTVLEQEPKDTPEISTADFIAANAQLGTFYNHLSVAIDGSNYTPSGLREDLGIFEIKNKKEFNKLKNGLSYLRSYIITTKIAKTPITSSIFTNPRRATKFSEITRKIVGDDAGKFYRALNNGTFLIKLTNSNNPYAQTYDSVNRETSNAPSDVLGRIVYQIKDPQGLPYDITIGAVSSDFVSQLVNTGRVNGSSIAKPEGNNAIYFKFNGDPEWTINSMKPLTQEDGFDVSTQNLKELKKSHPELVMSEALIANNGKNKGKPFIIYSYNLFEDGSTQNLAALRNRELNRKGANSSATMTTSVLYLDRIGYTLDEWMDQFEDWISVNLRKLEIGLFTGYMTGARFVASMIDYYNTMPDGELKQLLKGFLSGRVEGRLMSSSIISLSKTQENIENIVNWIEANKNNGEIFDGWLYNDTSAFNEEKFLKSSRKIADAIQGKNVKDIISTLTSIKTEITRGSKKYGDMTTEVIDEFITEINNLTSILKQADSAKVPNTEYSYTSNLIYEWLSNGILVRSSKMHGLIYDIYSLWTKGSVGNTDLGEGYIFPADQFRPLFREIIENSSFFRNGMIFREGRAYKGSKNKGIIEGSYYLDSNPEENFNVTTNIQLPSVYFNKNNTVDLAGFTTQEEVKLVTEQEQAPVIEVNSFEQLKEGLLNLQQGNIVWLRAVNRLFSNQNLSPELMYEELDRMVGNPNVSWRSTIERIDNTNRVSKRPEIVLRNGLVEVNLVYAPLTLLYQSPANPRFDLNTINITEFRSVRDFDFEEGGMLYRFNGSDEGTYATDMLTKMIDTQEINSIIDSFIEEGELYGAESEYREVGNILKERYADVNRFNEDMNNPNIQAVYNLIIPISVNPDLIIIMSESLEAKFDKIKCNS